MTMDKDETVAEAKGRSGLIVTKPTIVAMLKNGPLFLKIFAAPGNEAGLIAEIEDDEDGDNAAESWDGPNDVHTNLGGAGVTVGYDTADLNVALGITSDEDYNGEYPDQPADHVKGTPEDASFAISVDLGVDVGPAKLQLQVVQGLKAAEDMDIVCRRYRGCGQADDDLRRDRAVRRRGLGHDRHGQRARYGGRRFDAI